MPEIPLSVGSKLELLLSLPNVRILPRAYCRVYTCILAIIYNVQCHDRGAEGFAL